MEEIKTDDIPTINDEKVEDIEDFPDNKDDHVKWFMKRDGLKNPDDVLKVLHSFKVGPMKMNDFINIMKNVGSKSAISAMYEYEKDYKETYGNSLSVIGSAVKRKLLNKKLIQIMDKIKYEKEMTGPRPKKRPENTATAMSKHIESTVFENKQKEASNKISAIMKGNSARKKVAIMKEKEKTRVSNYLQNIVDNVIEKKENNSATKISALFKGTQLRKKMNIQEQPLNIPQGKSKATIMSQDTTAGEKGDVPRTVLIKVDEFFSNFVNKEQPIRFDNMKGSDALLVAQNREKPIGVKKFANLYKYTNDYWDTVPIGGRITFNQRLKNNNLSFNSKEDFLNSFNIDTRTLTVDAITARDSASKAGPSRRSQAKKK
jgi:hypothetical protein